MRKNQMGPMEHMGELLVRQQRENLGNGEPESRGNAGNVCCDRGYIAETSSSIKEVEPIPVKITILHTKKESIIVKAEGDPRKPWYFTHV
jgi:hypothetical protein